ncbi:MAG: diguanylate cyclase domain-containing protein [Devosia sp.]
MSVKAPQNSDTNGTADGPLPDPRRLVIGSVAAILVLAATVVVATFYAVASLDRASVAEEVQRARAALATVGVGALAETQLQRDFLLSGARFTTPNMVRPDETTVPLADGRVMAWVPLKIGTSMLMHLAPIRLAASGVFLIGVGLVLRRLYGMTRELERRRREADERALTDPLTGLGNRMAFERWGKAAAARGVSEIGLLYLDLDDFKAINDRFGHGAGDELLQVVSRRIAALKGADDLVARMGGDEFAFVRPGPVDRMALAELAADIGTTLSEPVRIGTLDVMLGSSVGVAVGRPDDSALLAKADAALYRAKAKPGHTFVFADAA